MSFLGGILPPPKSLGTRSRDDASQPVERPSGGSFRSSNGSSSGATSRGESGTSLYSAFSGVKSMVSSYSSTSREGQESAGNEKGNPQSQTEKELQITMSRFRLQSPENHLGMLMAFNEKTLSPFLAEDFCFTWHRVHSGYLEDIHYYNHHSMNSQSFYPPSADDLGSVVVLHCEDTLGYGISCQLESSPIKPDASFAHKVETAIEQNKIMERVVISTCNHSFPSTSVANSLFYSKKNDLYQENKSNNENDNDYNSSDDDESDSQNSHITIPEFEVGGSIAVNSEGILLREKGTHDCGLHIDSTNFLSLTCQHPASFVIELPLYYASSSSGASSVLSSPKSGNKPMAPISSIRDLSSISTMRPSMEWLGEPEGDMYACLEEVVDSDDNPLEKSLEELAGGDEGEDGGYELLFSSIRLQVSCRDRATRDLVVLAIRSLAGFVIPESSSANSDGTPDNDDLASASNSTNNHMKSLPQRLSVLPWHTPNMTTVPGAIPAHRRVASSPDMEGMGRSKVALAGCSSSSAPIVNSDSELRKSSDLSHELELLVEKLTTENEELRKENVEQHNELIQLKEQMADERSTNLSLELKCDDLSKDLSDMNRKADDLEKNVAVFHEEKNNQSLQIAQLAELVQELEAARAEVVSSHGALEEQNCALRKALDDHEQKEKKWREEGIVDRTNLSTSVSNSSALVEGQGDESSVNSDEMEALKAKCDEYLSKLLESEASIIHLQEQLSLRSQDLSHIQDHLTEAETETETDSDKTVSVVAYPTSEMRSVIMQFNMIDESEMSRDDSIMDGGQDLFLSLVDIIRSFVSTLVTQQNDCAKKLTLCEMAAQQAQTEHNIFLRTLEDKMQIISNEMTEKDEVHKKQCLSYVETIDGLNESVNVLQEKLKKLDDYKRNSEMKISSLQDDLNTQNEKCDSLTNEAATREINQKNDLQIEYDKLSEECDKWNQECLRLKDLMLDMQKTIQLKEEASLKEKKDFDLLTVRLQEVKQHNEILTTQASKDARLFKEKSDKLTYELSQATHTVQVMEARVSGLQSETLTLADERQVLKRQQSAFESSRSQIVQLRGQLMESDQSALAARALLDETSAQNDKLKKEHKDMSLELANVNNLLTQKVSRIEELKDRIQVMENEITSSDKVKSSFRKENARLKDAAKKLKEDSDTVKKLKPLYNQQLSKIADGQSKIVDLESALSDVTLVRNNYAVTVSSLELRVGSLERKLHRREVHSEREGMLGEEYLSISKGLFEKSLKYRETISQLEADLSEAKTAEPFQLKKLNFMVSKLSGEKNHFENKAKSLSKDLQRKLLAGTPLQRELGKMTARLEEVENERNAYRDAMVLACETYSAKDVSYWFG